MKKRSKRSKAPDFQRLFAWFGLLVFVGSFLCYHFFGEPWEPARFTETPPQRELPTGQFSLVILDPGHGGGDSGAEVGGVREKDLTLDVARRAERLLQLEGLQTLLTRDNDRFVSLAERASVANRQHDCIFVSVHFNHEKKEAVTGVETYYAARQVPVTRSLVSWLPFLRRTISEPATAESESLARFLQEALVARTGALNRGTKTEQFYVISRVWHPAALVEGGFISNRSDATRLATAEYRQQIAVAISDGVKHYREVMTQKRSTLAVAASE